MSLWKDSKNSDSPCVFEVPVNLSFFLVSSTWQINYDSRRELFSREERDGTSKTFSTELQPLSTSAILLACVIGQPINQTFLEFVPQEIKITESTPKRWGDRTVTNTSCTANHVTRYYIGTTQNYSRLEKLNNLKISLSNFPLAMEVNFYQSIK